VQLNTGKLSHQNARESADCMSVPNL